jgi:hypothetical protein
MTTLTVDIDEVKSEKALKAVIEAFDLNYDIDYSDDAKGNYDPEFVARIEKSKQDYKDGKGVKITLDEIWKL